VKETTAFVDFPKIPTGAFVAELDRELADPNSSAIGIRFPAGLADPTEELEMLCATPPVLSGLRQTLRTLEKGTKPVVAWIESDLAGLAFEVALACHRRFTSNKRIRFTWPWMKFGLPPLLGATQRLPYLVGLQSTLDCLLFDQPIIAESVASPLVDLVKEEVTKEEAIAAWTEDRGKPAQPWDQADITQSSLSSQTIANRNLLQSAYLRVRQKSPPEDVAPGLLLQVFHDGLERTFDAGLKLEAAAFEKARVATSTKQRIYAQHELPQQAIKRAAKIPTTTRTLGVIGSGLMGTGIAYTAASAGLEVRLFDVNTEAISRSLDRIKKLSERRPAASENGDQIVSRIRPIHQLSDLAECGFVIEAVFERLETKQEVLAGVSSILSADSVLASNTTTFPISELANSVSNPANFIGTHFFAPVEQMDLLEIILGRETSENAQKIALGLASRLNKVPLVVRDGPGFYTSRVVMAYIQEALLMLAEGIAPSLIDNAARNAGMILGPLTMADLTSLDLLEDIFQNLAQHARGSAKFAQDALDILVRFTNAKRFGRKSGAGIYNYTAERSRLEWPELVHWYPRDPRPPTAEEIGNRLMFIQTIETLHALREGIIDAPELADLASVLGWRYPAFRGGVMRVVHVIGIERFETTRQELQAKFGPRFAIPAQHGP
jgi:3-hydroxyacyl-CoA dehydrogenase / enoyl-CoA hydratase / 3-hydroxybutyryl-CoA epimerase